MGLRVVVINERDTFCDLLSALLSAEGHAAVCARGFREALRAACELKADLIILEIAGTDIGALEIVQRLQRSAETRHIPIIAVSDCPDLEYELLNVFDFLAVPIDLARLREDLEMLAGGRKKRPNIEPLTSGDHQLFYDYLITHTGLHFERRNLKILERGVTARMDALRVGSYREYFDYLTRHHHDRQEMQKLLTFLTVGETYFFRYRAHFDALRKFIASELADKKGKRIRLWSAGCSTGEEPYSMAMTVMEAFPDWRKRDIRIIATDINNKALKKAREGVYGPWAMRVIDKRYLDRYFDKVGKSYIIREDVKSLVDFSHLNLHTDRFPTPDGEFRDLDVIFCRNVMIYFSLSTTRQIVEKIAASLVPGGLLFLGHSETLFQISSRFERHSHGGSFYYREKKGRSAPPPRAPVSPAPAPAPAREKKPVKTLPAAAAPPKAEKPALPPPAPEQDMEGLYQEAQALFEAEKFQEASALLEEVVERNREHTGALVLQAFVMANYGRFQEALDLCRMALTIDDLLPEAYFLEGLVLDMTDRLGEAAEEYRKAILLRMEFVMSHYYLGRLYFRLGRETDGMRELRNTLKILEKERKESVIPFSGGLSREVLLHQVRDELARVA